MKNNVFCYFTTPVINISKWETCKLISTLILSCKTRECGVKIDYLTQVKICLVVFVLRLCFHTKISNMSKLSFRARALDASKPMPVYRSEEVPDLPDFAAINRAVPQMPTGMEKEEECEHHLQRAISAQQAFGHTGELVIPTPEVFTANEEDYENIYPGTYKMPRQLIHMQPFAMDQDIPDYDMDSEDEKWINQQARKMDITSMQFEEIMDRLEKNSGQQVVTLKEAKLLIKEDDDLIIAVYDYWLNKRLRLQHPLIPTVKTEKRDGSTNNNPYVAFRRRTEKMQTRKNRKNDEASYEKMLKLRRDLSRAVTLLEMVKRREKTKREHLHLTIEIFEKRHQAGDYSGHILTEVSAMKHSRSNFVLLQSNNQQALNKQDGRVVSKTKDGLPQKKRQYIKRQRKPDIQTTQSQSHHLLPVNQHNRNEVLDYIISDGISSDDEALSRSSSPSDREDENDPDGPFVFRRKKLCNYHSPLVGKLGNWPWCSPEDGGLGDKKFRYCLTSISLPRPRCVGFSRRRVGRGGRIHLDRAWTPLDDCWADFDLSTPHSPPNGIVQPANEFFSEIKNEWLHFRPETSHSSELTDNLYDLDDTDGTDYSNFNVLNTGGSVSSMTGYLAAPFNNDLLLNASGDKDSAENFGSSRSTVFTRRTCDTDYVASGASDFNLESFQNHREELFEMQRKQLERLKSEEIALGLRNEMSASGRLPNSHQQIVRKSQGDSANNHSNYFTVQPASRVTLDSASAQFAVSAVLSPSDMSEILNSLVSSPLTSSSSSLVPVTTLSANYSSHNSWVPVVTCSGLSTCGHSITSSNSKMAEAVTTSTSFASTKSSLLPSNGPTSDTSTKSLEISLLNKHKEQDVPVSQRVSSIALDSSDMLMNQLETLVEITLPDGSITSGRVHLEPSMLAPLQQQFHFRNSTGAADALQKVEFQSNPAMTKSPVQQGQQLKHLQQPNLESNCSELVSSTHRELPVSKMKMEIAQSDCGYTLDVT